MPELPEVETTRQGLLPHVENQQITNIICRHRQLRYPIDQSLEQNCITQTIHTIERRSKYLKLMLDHGYILIHLGMSGNLRVLPIDTPASKHDHVDIHLNKNQLIRYTDPRRFGMVNWFDEPDHHHPLLKNLAPEPLTRAFSGKYLFNQCQNTKKFIKKVIMDNHIVAGVGNIYAQESLFLSNIAPHRSANTLSLGECQQLTHQIKQILKKAIKQGGTTLKDFQQVDGKPGYFAQTLRVYGRASQPCCKCKKPLQKCQIDNRTTTYCSYCQY